VGIEGKRLARGEEGLAYLCKKAENMGMKIIIWIAPAHLSHSSPILKEHPEWIIMKPNGTPDHFNYAEIVGVNLRRGYLDYAMEQFEKSSSKNRFSRRVDGFVPPRSVS